MSNANEKPTLLVQNRQGELFIPRTHAERLLASREAIQRAVASLRAQELIVKIPRLAGLFRKEAPFHATPELFLQQFGSTRFTMPEETFELQAGEVCLMPRGMPHDERTSAPHQPYQTLILMFQQDSFSLHFGYATEDCKVTSDAIERFPGSGHALLARYLDEVVAARQSTSATAEDYVFGLLLAALGKIAVELEANRLPSTLEHPLVVRCLDLMQVRMADPALDVRTLARELGCTPDHLSRVFHQKTGRRLMETLHAKRIALAKDLLPDLTLHVGEVAWACGFATQSYFNRLFRKYTGETPGTFRAKL